MPTLPTAGADVEALVRGLIATKCGTVPGVGNVFNKPFYVSGKQQYVAKLGVDNEDSGVEVRYLFVDFGGWENTDRGCDANPIYYLLYTLRVAQEFVNERSDGGSSSQDFAAQCMSLRDAFLTGRELGYAERLYTDLLVVSEEVALHDDPHTGMFGHTVEFLLKVEVTPVG